MHTLGWVQALDESLKTGNREHASDCLGVIEDHVRAMVSALKNAERRLAHTGQALADGGCNYTACALCAVSAALDRMDDR